MKVLKINTKSKNYNIYVGHNIISKLNLIIKKEKINFKKTLIVVDKNIPKSFVKKVGSTKSSPELTVLLLFFVNKPRVSKSSNLMTFL